MIREIILLVVADVTVVRQDVTDVVVLLDEPLELGNHFNNSDIHIILRTAILNEPIGNLRCTLLMSSLDTLQIGNTNSKRGIIVSRLPEILDEDEIVDKIFNINNSILTEKERFKWKLIASLVSNLPRIVQFTKNVIIKMHKDKMMPQTIDAKFVKQLFAAVISDAKNRYNAKLPSAEILYRMGI